MASLGKNCYTENLTVTVLGSNGTPVQTIYRASTDYYQNDLNWIETDSNELRFRLKEDGHLQIVEGLELFHGTEDIRTATKQFSVGLNSTGSFVVRDEVHSRDVISISSGGQLHLDISQVNGLQAAIDAGQQQFFTQGGLSVNATVLDTFALTAAGDGSSYANSLLTAKAMEDFMEGFQESVITVLPGQDSGHRIGTITSTPSSTNVPSALAVSNYVTSRLNSYTGDSGKAFTSSTHTLASSVKLAATSLSTQPGLQVTDVSGGSSFISADAFILSGTSIITLLDGKQDAGDYVTSLSLGDIDNRLTALEGDSYISTSGAGLLEGSLSVSGIVTVGGVLSAAVLDNLDTRLDALETDSYISTSGAGVLDGSLSVSGVVTVGNLSTASITAVSIYKNGVSVLDANEVSSAYASQAALSSYGGNSSITFNARKIILDNKTAFNATSYSSGLFSFNALSIRDPQDSQYLRLYCSDVFYGLNGNVQLSSVINDINSVISSKHPLTEVDPTAGGTISSGHLITSGAVHAGNQALQAQIDTKQPAGSYLTAVPSGTDAILIADGSVNNASFQHLAGVTSSIQSQLNNKSPLFSIDAVPTLGSSNLVTSGGVHSAITGGAQVVPQHSGSLSVSGVITASSISIGTLTSKISQIDLSASLAIGFAAGTTQEAFAIAIGSEAGQTQSLGGVAIGRRAGRTAQRSSAVAIGNEAGRQDQGLNCVAIGVLCGFLSQGADSVAVGFLAGATVQGGAGVAVGRQAGSLSQGAGAVAVGGLSGLDGQGDFSVAIGNQCGFLSQGDRAVAIGQQAGREYQGIEAVAIGRESGRHVQGGYGVAVGYRSGYLSQGAHSIAFGSSAGYNSQHTRSIVLNATGVVLDSQQADALYVKPVREAIAASLLFYDSTTGEITHSDSTGALSASSVIVGGVLSAAALDDMDTRLDVLEADSYISTSGAGVLDGSLSVSGAATLTSLSIGTLTSYIELATNTPLAIGYRASFVNQHQRTITLNARTTELNTQTEDAFYAAPLRLSIGSHLMQYNSSTLEVTYSNTLEGTLVVEDIIVNAVSVGQLFANNLSASGSVFIGTGIEQIVLERGALPWTRNKHEDNTETGAGSLDSLRVSGGLELFLSAASDPANDTYRMYDVLRVTDDRSGVNDNTYHARLRVKKSGEYPSTIHPHDEVLFDMENASVHLSGASSLIVEGYISASTIFAPRIDIGQQIAIGFNAAVSGVQGTRATAIGYRAGEGDQSEYSIALGAQAALSGQGSHAIAIGRSSGQLDQGDYSIALGAYAGGVNQHANSTIINASGLSVQTSASDATYITPLRNVAGTSVVQYNHTSKELTYSSELSNITSLSVSSITIGSSIALPSNVQYVAQRHSYANTLTALSSSSYSDASSFTNIVLGNVFGSWAPVTESRDITFVLIQGFSSSLKLENTNQDFSSFVVGETVTVSGFAAPIAGIATSDLNRTHVVTVVDPDFIRVSLSVQANSDGYTSFVSGINVTRTLANVGLGNLSFREAFNDTGYDEHTGSGVFTPNAAYGNRLFRVRCSITAQCTGSAAIYLELMKGGIALIGARLPVDTCTTTLDTLVFIDGATESISFRLNNQSAGTWSLELDHTEPYLASMAWELQ